MIVNDLAQRSKVRSCGVEVSSIDDPFASREQLLPILYTFTLKPNSQTGGLKSS